MNAEAVSAVGLLFAAGESVHIIAQNISELWNVCTRPSDKNGLGLTPEETEAEINKLEKMLALLPDNERIYPEWRKLVIKHSVLGVSVHDARLVAAMKVHKISHILTFNDKDFRRYEPGIKVMTPKIVIEEYS